MLHTPKPLHMPLQTKDTFVGAYQWTECKAVDVAGIDLDACWSAPPSNPCTEACKATVDKMPQDCVSLGAAARRWPCLSAGDSLDT